MWLRGKIQPNWTSEQFKNYPFVHKSAKQELLVEWTRRGYKFEKYTGDMFNIIGNIPQWMSSIAEQVGLENCGYTVYKMNTGVVMPLHIDHFDTYCKIFNTPVNDVWRCIVALEDWQSGHYLEIDNTPITNYKAGEYVMWSHEEEHMAANIGCNPRYTLQITGKKM